MASRDLRDRLQTSYVLFSCEGTAEEVVIDTLINADALIVPKDHLVEDPVYYTLYTRLRKADKIADRFFMHSYEGDDASGLLIGRIVDSRAGRFTLPRRWQGTCEVESFYTRPEIEMLLIHAEGAFNGWLRASRRNRSLRPSEFCKGELGMNQAKQAAFLRSYWNADKLIQAIHKYSQHKGGGGNELSLLDLLID